MGHSGIYSESSIYNIQFSKRRYVFKTILTISHTHFLLSESLKDVSRRQNEKLQKLDEDQTRETSFLTPAKRMDSFFYWGWGWGCGTCFKNRIADIEFETTVRSLGLEVDYYILMLMYKLQKQEGLSADKCC